MNRRILFHCNNGQYTRGGRRSRSWVGEMGPRHVRSVTPDFKGEEDTRFGGESRRGRMDDKGEGSWIRREKKWIHQESSRKCRVGFANSFRRDSSTWENDVDMKGKYRA